jgi:hypothetical protein
MSMSKSKKPKKDEGTGVQVPDVLKDAILARIDDAGARMKYPLLTSILMPAYEEGALVYQAGKLTVQVEGAHWRVKLESPTARLQLVMASGSLLDILEELESYLGSGRAQWMPGWEKNRKPLPKVDAQVK